MIDNRSYYPQQPIVPVNTKNGNVVRNSGNQGKDSTTPFSQVLAQELKGVQFSQHALQRLQEMVTALPSSAFSPSHTCTSTMATSLGSYSSNTCLM